ncbi:MAG: hypothetical protein L0Z73_14570 [Gammaproteobacteria bacterium]|nr:hypothetical protein [Gammaproteobacteria bacterium]
MLDWIFVTIFLVCAFAGIALVFYLGRHHVKEIDRIVYGFDVPSDSIFFKIQRIPTYGGAFVWRWGAKRSGLAKIRDKFDKKFKIPFIITFWLFVIGTISMIAGVIISKFVLH